jgi:hypothetical protein
METASGTLALLRELTKAGTGRRSKIEPVRWGKSPELTGMSKEGQKGKCSHHCGE